MSFWPMESGRFGDAGAGGAVPADAGCPCDGKGGGGA